MTLENEPDPSKETEIESNRTSDDKRELTRNAHRTIGDGDHQFKIDGVEKNDQMSEKSAHGNNTNLNTFENKNGMHARSSMRLFELIGKSVGNHPARIVAVIIFITLALLIPLQSMNTETSMDDFIPESDAVDAQETIDNDFTMETNLVFVIEAKEDDDGVRNILSRSSLNDMLLVEDHIRNDPELSDSLVEGNEVFSVADTVRGVLMLNFNSTILDAGEVEFLSALNTVLLDQQVCSFLSRDLDLTGTPKASAAIMIVKLDSSDGSSEEETFGNMGFDIRDSMDEVEHDHITISMAEGMDEEMENSSSETLSRLMPVCIVVIIVVLYLSLRKLSDLILALVAVPIIFIWTFGITSIIGLGFSQFTFVAPILILLLGIDYGIHSLHRYREELKNGLQADRAVQTSITHVGSALFLTTITTAVAFLSNMVSEVPAIRDFGITLSIGITSAFLIMGVFLPALRLSIDNVMEKRTVKSTKRIPDNGKNEPGRSSQNNAVRKTGKDPILVRTTDVALKNGWLIMGIVFLITIGSILGGMQLETEMKPTDIVRDDSEFAHAFTVLDREFPGTGNEHGYILITGNIATVQVFRAMNQTIMNLDDDSHVAQLNGTARSRSPLYYLRALVLNETLSDSLDIHDVDGDEIPDTDNEITTALEHIHDNGIMMNDKFVDQRTIRSVLHRNDQGEFDMALIVVEAKDVMGFKGEHLLEELEEDSRPFDDVKAGIVVTGSPVTRYEMLSAMTGGMVKSLFISIIMSTVFLILVFRSPKDGIITIIPVVLISTWVFGTMYLFGFSLNVVTVTIAAMTIGVGVDYSIHIRQRFREELNGGTDHEKAMDRAIEHSGKALMGAAGTTALGFGVLYFSEMNLFSMYGLLSGLMILYAFLAAIVVLPILLMFGDGKVQRSGSKNGPENGKI